MAATLPPISSVQPGIGKSMHITLNQPAAKNRGQNKKEREAEIKRVALRAQQPPLEKWQTAAYRNSFKHNLCLDMLQEGYHKSFTVLFQLTKQQNAERALAGPESVLWTQPMLENEPAKLEMLKSMLTKAEDAQRKDDFADVYICQSKLAKYFQENGDKWLADHFFYQCLDTSSRVKFDGGKMASSAYCNVGLALEESGEYFDAASNFEMCYDLTRGTPNWVSPSDFEACSHLCRIYTTIANQFQTSGDLQQFLGYLQKAYDMAKEGGEKGMLGLASYRLGIAYEKNNDSTTALLYLNGYLDICSTLSDSDGTGKACEAIAKSYHSKGQVEECIRYLEMFVEVAERSEDEKAISRACSNLGAMFNSMGRYDQAVEHFNKAYNIARAMNDTESISSSRVLYGVAVAHKMLEGITKHINMNTQQCVERLIEWKDNRGDEFEKEAQETETKEENK